MTTALGLLVPVSALGLGTPAGSLISNTAAATYLDAQGQPQAATSNTASLRVDEVLDATVVANDSASVVTTTPDGSRPLSFTLTNTGNGSEIYRLATVATLGGDQFDPVNVRIYLDDGDGVFSSTADTLLVPGGNDPVLAANASRRIFVVADIPAGRSTGETARVRLTAEADTAQTTPGPDTPGTAFTGQGTGGGDAVVGTSGAYATADGGYVVSQIATALNKTQTVQDRFGGSNPISGALITYRLTFTATGSGSLSGTQIADPIPAGTHYVPGSLQLDGTPLSDGNDADAGRYDSSGNTVSVALGTITAPASHTVTFQVTID